MHMSFRAAIAGVSGYAGGEIARLLTAHPDITLSIVTGASSAGNTLAQMHPNITGPQGALVIQETTAQALGGVDVIFLALPHGHSARLSDELARAGTSALIIDCAADHRLTDADEWHRYYGTDAAEPWTYGMPELLHSGETQMTRQRDALAHACQIAVPGCNATAVTLAIQPAIAAHIVEPTLCATLSVGYSGAGRSPKQHLLASEALGAIVPYGVGGTHRHIPEIIQNLRISGADDVRLTFTPVLVPTARGIVATVVAPLHASVSADDVAHAYSIYDNEPLIGVSHEAPWPSTAPVNATGCALVNAVIDERAHSLVTICALDNLGKGTASAAIQSANLALGLPELTGIPTIGVTP